MSNNLKLKSLSIEGFQNKRRIHLLFKDVTVLVGRNGSGKTTILRTLESLLLNTPKNIPDVAGEVATLSFTNGERVAYARVTPDDVYKKNNDLIHNGIDGIYDDISSDEKIKSLGVSESIIKDIIKSKLEEYTRELIKKKLLEMSGRAVRYSADGLRSEIEGLQVRYISTVIISANSEKEMSFGNSKTKNILDVSIELELSSLSKKGAAINRFINSINELLSDTEKLMSYKPNKGFWVKMKDGEILLSELSAGEKQLIFILATVANTYGNPALFLMDEPEISLHLSWQEKIIDAVKKINSEIQIIIATHSPAIVMNGYMDSYIDMNSIDVEGENE